MDKLIKKLTRLLSRAGVEPEIIDKVVAELTGEADEQANPTLSDIAPKEDNAPQVEDTPLPPAESDGPAPQDEALPPVEEAPVEDVPQELPVPEEETLAPLPNEVNPAELILPGAEQPTTPDTPAPAPIPEPDVELQGKVEEQAKTIEGLLSRIDALEEALKASGVLTVEEEGVGLDNPRTPANNPEDDPMDSVLAKINGKRF